MSGRWKRFAALGAASALCVVVTAGIASARPTAGAGQAATTGTLNIYGMGGRDDVAQGRINIATKLIEEASDKLAFAAHFVGLEGVTSTGGGSGTPVASPR